MVGKRTMKKEQVILYIHGKGGNAKEAEHYKPLFPDAEVIGFSYTSETPWDAKEEFEKTFRELEEKYTKVCVIANSIGAYFTMCSNVQEYVSKAYFISPIVDMEYLILDMMKWANVTEEKLQEKKEILTEFGEILSWEYLEYVRNHPIQWNVKTHVLYGEKDHLTSLETMSQFVQKTKSDLTIMPLGEHWFHTDEQMEFLDSWILIKENLMDRIELIHTTEMGMERIKKNLGIEEDGVKYCQKRILDPKTNIIRKGKNWYCETDSEIITINAKSLTIITAHRRK